MYWSNLLPFDGSLLVTGRETADYGPGAMNWLRKKLNWPECVVLDPVAGADAEFVMGFSTQGAEPGKMLCMVAPFSAARRINDGPFAMRLGPQPVKFFVVGTAPVKLEEIGRKLRGTPEDQAAKNIIIY